MNFFKFLFIPVIITSCQNSSRVKIPVPQNTEEKTEFQFILKERVCTIEYYSSKEITTEHRQLLRKVSRFIKTNAQTKNFFTRTEQGEEIPYHSNIGISRQEYNTLVDMFSYKDPEKFKGTLTIIRDGSRLKFKGDGRLSLLDSVIIDVFNRSASFRQYTMTRADDPIDFSNENIPDGDTLETFNFYSGPSGLIGLTALDGKYELLIGRLMPSDKIYLSFFARQPDIIEHPIPEYITGILY